MPRVNKHDKQSVFVDLLHRKFVALMVLHGLSSGHTRHYSRQIIVLWAGIMYNYSTTQSQEHHTLLDQFPVDEFKDITNSSCTSSTHDNSESEILMMHLIAFCCLQIG